jgi:hypothetical protein
MFHLKRLAVIIKEIWFSALLFHPTDYRKKRPKHEFDLSEHPVRGYKLSVF